MKIVKVRNVKTPSIGTTNSIGIDFFVPEFDDKFMDDFFVINPLENATLYHTRNDDGSYYSTIRVFPHSIVKIPSGIHIRIEDNQALMFNDKSSIATKRGLTKVAGIVDSDYKEEIMFVLLNYTNKEVSIEQNEKIIQGIITTKVVNEVYEFTDLNTLYEGMNSNRTGGFGSTGKF